MTEGVRSSFSKWSCDACCMADDFPMKRLKKIQLGMNKPFGVRKHHFSSYLAELMWRYKNREGDLFEIFLRYMKCIMYSLS